MYVPRKYGQTTSPSMIFHHPRGAKPMLNSQPANQKAPMKPPAFFIVLSLFFFSSSIFFFPNLPFHQIDIVDVDIGEVAEDGENYRQADGYFGGGNHHHEDGEDLAGQQQRHDMGGKNPTGGTPP